MKQQNTILTMLSNFLILCIMLNLAGYFWYEMIQSDGVLKYLLSAQLTAVIISFTFSPSKSDEEEAKHWLLKANCRQKFLILASVLIAAIEAIKAIRWFYLMIISLM
jgi:hypothetical protein